ncbi:MAG TPA: response regulator transcription factor [Burkholderiales bacterium]|nr:response regulator transcription factor [Burkholderiales bacterium]
MNILVVEDQQVVRELLTAVATSALAGARVTAVGDLESALEAARAMPVDLVLLDLGLPGCRGIDALKRFKEAYPSVVIVIVSSNDDSRVISDALAAGASGYLTKGVSPSGLASALAGLRRPAGS